MSRFLNSRFAAIEPYTPGEQPQGQMLKLNANENPFPPSPAVRAALSGEQIDQMRLYPDMLCQDLVQAVCEVYGVAPGEVLCGNGSDELLAFLFQTLCPHGAAFADITYSFYPVYAQVYGVPVQLVPLREDFRLAVEDYAGLPGTVFIANPNAPTTLALGKKQIIELLEQDRDRLVVVDEAYVDFGAQSAVELIHTYDNLVVVKTLSKSYSLAGARVGFALACPAIIADLNTAKFCFNPYNINRLSLLAGAAALRDRDYFHHTVGRIIANRERLQTGLQNLGFHVLDGQANFLMAGRHPKLSAKDYFLALRERGILIRYFSQQRLADFVRITIGDEAATDALLAATKAILEKAVF